MFQLKPYLILTIIAAASAGFLFGVNTGNIAGALPFIQKQFATTTLQNELLVSSTILFAFLSAISSVKIAKKYGHRKLLLLTGICFVVGSFMTSHADSVNYLIVARALLGIAIGISSYAGPLYIAEIAPIHFRGFFVLLNGVAITGGEAVAFCVDYVCSAQSQWRIMLAWSIVPAIIFLISMCLMPCAPRWLVARGEIKAGTRILEKFQPQNTVAALIQDMQQVKTYALPSISDLLSQKQYRMPLIVGISLGMFQQFFGINTIMYYGPFIFEKAGFSLLGSAIWVTFIMGVVNMITTIITGLFVDKMGRRFMLLLGSGIAFASLTCIACLFNVSSASEASSFCMMIAMIMYIIGYCMSVGSLFWLIISEIFPASIRDLGASLATGMQWFANFVVSITFLSMLDYLGPSATFFTYAIICLSAMVFVYYLVPETKRLSLEAIEQVQFQG